MSETLKNWFQVGAWFVAIVGGLIAASKSGCGNAPPNAQRSRTCAKRAEMAKKCLDEIFGDQLASAALKMLDWDNLRYDIPSGGKTGAIDHEGWRNALRTSGTVFRANGQEQFVRDAFDALFDSFQMLEHFIRIGLIVFLDVQRPLSYYVKKLSSPDEYRVIRSFLLAYDLAIRN